MVDQRPHRGGQPPARGEHQMDDAAMRAPWRQQAHQPTIVQRFGADMIGQQRHPQIRNGGGAHGGKIAACHARFVAQMVGGAIAALQMPVHLADLVAGAQRRLPGQRGNIAADATGFKAVADKVRAALA